MAGAVLLASAWPTLSKLGLPLPLVPGRWSPARHVRRICPRVVVPVCVAGANPRPPSTTVEPSDADRSSTRRCQQGHLPSGGRSLHAAG